MIADVINQMLRGRLNVVGTVTLTASAASTTLSDANIGYKSAVFLTPTTANAATELATLYMTWPNTTQGEAVINHANNAQVDRTYVYAVIG